jgi:hypothetical protein
MGYIDDNSWENALSFNCPPSPAMPQGCQQMNYGPTAFDHTQMFKMSFMYDLPFGNGKKWASSSRAANDVIGGWKVNGVWTSFTGEPLYPGQDQYFINTPMTPQNPWYQGTVHETGGANDQYGYPHWFQSTDFAPNLLTQTAGIASLGNMHRDATWLTGPGLWQIDFSVFRDFKIRERYDLEIRFQSQNIGNNHHFWDPNMYCTDVNGACGGGFSELTGAYGQRVVMLGVRLKF